MAIILAGVALMEMQTMLVTAFSGGLAGAFLTLLTNSLFRWWNRPILQIIFSDDEPGCRVKTPACKIDSSGNPSRDAQGNIQTVRQFYLRLKLKDKGNTFAENVSVCVTEIIYRAPGSGEKIFKEEVFDLKLAMTSSESRFNLASKGHRFVDFVHTEESLESVALVFDFVKNSVRLNDLGFGIGVYEVTIFASANNANSRLQKYRVNWDGSLDGLAIQAI